MTNTQPWDFIDGSYVAEDSDFGPTTQRNCPVCAADNAELPWQAGTDAGDGTTHWTRTCNCGAHLIIFND